MLKDSLSINQLLGNETSSGEHGQAAVLELLGLHLEEFLRVLRGKSKRVKVQVPRSVVFPELESILALSVLRVLPPDLRAVGLDDTDAQNQNLPEGLGNLGKVGDGRTTDLGVKEERRTLLTRA